MTEPNWRAEIEAVKADPPPRTGGLESTADIIRRMMAEGSLDFLDRTTAPKVPAIARKRPVTRSTGPRR